MYKSLCCLVLAFAGSLELSHSAVIMGVDFEGISGSGAVTQSGFLSYTSTSGSQSFSGVFGISSGSATVSLPNGGSSRFRSGPLTNTATFTDKDLLRDLYTGLHGNPQGSAVTSNNSLSISGLDPNTSYTIQIFTLDVDNNPGGQATWYDSTFTGSGFTSVQSTDHLLGTITNVTGVVTPADNNAFSVTGTVTTNASGVLSFKISDTAGSGTINGFILSTVPEPGLASLSLFGVVSLALRRQRKQAA